MNDHLKMIKTNKITYLLPVFCIINLNIVSWIFLCYFPFDSFEKVDCNIHLHGDYQSYEHFEFFWNFKKIWNLNIFKFCGNFQFLSLFLEFLKFWNFMKNSEFSLIDDEVRVFRINIKLLSNPVAELKIHENDSHWRSIVLKIMDRSIVKQLEKEQK